MMIDTHCHLDIEEYEDIDKVIKNMKNHIMIASGYNTKTNERVIQLVNEYDNIYGTIGIHPSEVKDMNEQSLKYIEANLNNPKIVGVGEIGLDYHYDGENKDLQKNYFIKQIELAKKYNKTIVVHSRDSASDTYEILKKNLGKNKAVMHCFSYSLEMAIKYQELGLKFGIGGVITFKNAIKLKDVVKNISLDNLLLETDSPYLCPEPFRGQENEPKNVYLVASKIAEIKNISIEEVINKTTKNAITEFDLHM